MQIFVLDKGHVKVYPTRRVSEYPHALKQFAKDINAPEILVVDPHPVQKSKDVKYFCNKIGTTPNILEKSIQWANHAELYVGLIKNQHKNI